MTSGVALLGLSGSLRAGSYNTALLHAVEELLPAGMTMKIHGLRDIPPYDEDVRAKGYPAAVQALRDALAKADGVVIVTPEYNRSVPGVLKNAIDWVSRGPDQPFARKSVAIMTASTGLIGGAFANYHLRQILVYLNAQMVNGPEVLVSGSRTRFDDNGKLVDQATREFVRAHLVRLAELIHRWR